MTFLVVIIILALIFDYINGFHDAANSIATIVSTKVLTPFQAVLWAAFFNFAAFFVSKYIIGEFKIGNTIARSVDDNFITLHVIFAGLIAAIAWNLLTWRLGIPSSSSHALIGGLLGATLISAGFAAWQVDGIVGKVLVPLFGSPIIGFTLGLLFIALLFNIFRRAHPARLNGDEFVRRSFESLWAYLSPDA